MPQGALGVRTQCNLQGIMALGARPQRNLRGMSGLGARTQRDLRGIVIYEGSSPWVRESA
eukprot:8690497-Pyramimonas_sp.AAC.1